MGAEYLVFTHWLNIVGAAEPTATMVPTPMRHIVPRESYGMARETGVDREGPAPPCPVTSISWVGPGGPNIGITKMGSFISLGLFFSNCNSCIGGFWAL